MTSQKNNRLLGLLESLETNYLSILPQLSSSAGINAAQSAEFMRFLIANKSLILSAMLNNQFNHALCERLKKAFAAEIYSHNQFLPLSEEILEKIDRIYAYFIDKLIEALGAEGEITNQWLEVLIIDHSQYLLKLKQNWETTLAQKNLLPNKAISQEYSAELQMALLHLDIKQLQNPILDIGAGKNYQLVQWLRKKGLVAYALDWQLTGSEPYLIQQNWLDYNYQPAAWGTIISQMAFSNHFIFNHWYDEQQAEQYAKVYMKILAALVVNGSFYYAPGLPFIEPLLPAAQYGITKFPIDNKALANQPLSAVFKECLYSVKVTRLS